MTGPLGRLVRIENLRSEWPREDIDFTPWLAQHENLTILAETVGLDLQLETQEKNVGPFRADILCRDTSNDSWVLVENQLERTDHTHLGQLLTYGAGLHAVTIIWIAQRFTEEHRAALDWLNEITHETFRFFGLEIELWKIGDSPSAPKFNIVSQPNDWSRQVQERARKTGSEFSELYYEYWAAFLNTAAASGLRLPQNPRASYAIRIPLGLKQADLHIGVSQRDGNAGTWIVLRTPTAQAAYDALIAQKDEIESALPEPPEWTRSYLSYGTAQIAYRLTGLDLTNRDDWARQHRFLADRAVALYTVFQPLLAAMDFDELTQKVIR